MVFNTMAARRKTTKKRDPRREAVETLTRALCPLDENHRKTAIETLSGIMMSLDKYPGELKLSGADRFATAAVNELRAYLRPSSLTRETARELAEVVIDDITDTITLALSKRIELAAEQSEPVAAAILRTLARELAK
jgi:hypothetical protein